ncbi:MAG: PAS domain S-box protein, partial [Phycisphaeraceae bacterium]
MASEDPRQQSRTNDRVSAQSGTPSGWASAAKDEILWRTLLNTANDPILICALTEQGVPDRLMEVNDAALRLTGYSREELLGMKLRDLVDPSVDLKQRIGAMRAGEPLLVESVYVGKDGRRIPVEIHAQRFELEGRFLSIAVARDISERQRLAQQQRTLADAGRMLGQSIDYETTLSNVAGLLVPAQADWCVIDLVNAEGTLEPVAVRHTDPQKSELAWELRRRYPERPNHRVGAPRVARTGESELYAEIPDELLQQIARDEEHLRILRGLGLRSGAVVPLTAQDQTLGSMTLVGETSHRYSKDDLAFLEELGRRCGAAVAHARLYRQAQRELADRRRSERQREAILQAALDCIISMDRHGRIADFNPAAERTFGHRREDVIGQPLAETIIPERLREAHWRGLKRFLDSGEGPVLGKRVEMPALHADGHEFPAELAITYTGVQEGEPFFTAHLRDITERKRAEQLLVEQKRLLELIASGCPLDVCLSALCVAVPHLDPGVRASVLIADDQRPAFLHSVAAPDLRPSFSEKLKKAPINELAVGTSGEAVFYNESVTCTNIANDERWSQPWRDLCVENNILACHCQPVLGPDGRPAASFMLCFGERREPSDWERRVAEFGTHIASIALQRDRSDRALRESERRLRFVMDSVPQKIFTATPNGEIDYFNPVWTKFTGRPPEALRDWDWTHFIHPDDVEQNVRLWRHSLATGDPFQFEHRIRRFDGTYRWHISRARPMRDGTGRITMWIGSNTDVHELKATQERLRSLNQTLEDRVAERTATAEKRTRQVRRLTAELARAEQRERKRVATLLHDSLQQLLAAAKMRLDNLAHRMQDQQHRKPLDQVLELLDQSIEMSRSLTRQLSPPILHDAGLGPALRWLARWMQEHHDLAVKLDIDPAAEPESETVRIFAFEAVRELLFNVVKHAQVRQAEVEMKPLDGEELAIAIRDRGVGFDPKTLEDKGSMGIGLMNIHERLEFIGGRLKIASQPGEGSCMTLAMPMTYHASDAPWHWMLSEPETSQAEAPARQDATQPSALRPIRVLIVDDHDLFREGLLSLLAEWPEIQIVGEAGDGVAAIEQARQLEPEVILMDISMPRLSGIEATREI